MNLSDFSTGKRLQRVSLDDPVPDRIPAQWHGWMREQFAPQVRPGDVVYYYYSDRHDWELGMGSEGYILVRDGLVVDSFVVRMN